MQNEVLFQALLEDGRIEKITDEDLKEVQVNHSHESQSITFRHQGMNHYVELIKEDHIRKRYMIKVDGLLFNLTIHNQTDILIQELGLNIRKEKSTKFLEAPMPGLVLEIMVEAGDTVMRNDPLLVLEAMKMENVIQAPGSGTIKKIYIQNQSKVEKGKILIEFE